MSRIVQTPSGSVFLGAVDNDDDLAATTRIASHCPEFERDEDDECYTDGCQACFDCRHRRWLADGFSCLKGLLG